MTENKNTNPDKVLKAEERIKSSPWDIEAWNVLLRDAQSKPIEESRLVFERIVKQFPLSGQYVKSYIAQEKKAKNYENVDKLFKEYLPKIYHIDLWKYYLTYIKEKDNKTSASKERIAKAYDYATEHMGLDLKSFSIWSDYIYFLKSTQVKNQYAESQKTIATRRIYNRAIVTPMIGIETIWRDYNTFENSINNIIAKRFIEDRSRDYMNARRVAKEYEAITKGLNRNLPSVPPQNTVEEARQVELWKKYVAWEKSNPLNTDDQLTVTKRTMFAYEQCLLCLGHHPDIWYEAAAYLEQASKLLAEKGYQENADFYADKVAEMYHRGLTILVDNMLLGFAYADYEESRSKFEKVDAIYNSLINNTTSDPTLAYIQYSRFIRRSKGILAAREVFKRAREDIRTSYHIYVNSALMEHYCTKDPRVAQRIFELGLKKYMRVPQLVLAYIDYMDHLNEDNNTRVLFERALGSGHMTQDRAQPIWDKFLQFESFVGDLASILKVERRRLSSAQLSSTTSTASAGGISNSASQDRRLTAMVVDRYKFGDLYPCNDVELRSMGYWSSTTNSVGSSGFGLEATGSSLATTIIPQTSVTICGSSNSGVSGTELSGTNISTLLSVNTTTAGIGSCPKPDFSHMLPFKPRAYPRTGAHPVPGGEFPLPPAASSLLTLLPPPTCFQGPFVSMNELMEVLLDMKVPEQFAHPKPNENMVVDDGTALSIETAASHFMRKRRRLISGAATIAITGNNPSASNTVTNGGENNSDDEYSGGGPQTDAIVGGWGDPSSIMGTAAVAAAMVAASNVQLQQQQPPQPVGTLGGAVGGIPIIQTVDGPIIDVFKLRQQKRQKISNNTNTSNTTFISSSNSSVNDTSSTISTSAGTVNSSQQLAHGNNSDMK